MAVKVILPAQFAAKSLFAQVTKSFGAFKQMPDEVEFDFGALRFVRPCGVVFLSNLALFLHRNGCTVSFTNMNKASEPIRFLDDSLFFEQHLGEKLNVWSSPRATTRPLVEVRHTDSHGWVRNSFVPWLSQCSGIAEHDLGELATCISELFNNIDDHTEHDVGSIFAQWYPKENRVIVAVADFGAGIPFTVRRVWECPDDIGAILVAFEEGFTSQSTPRNQGAGLHFLLQNVVENLGGRLEVCSADGAVSFEKDGDSLIYVPYNDVGFCPGTLIVLEFNTGSIERTEGELEDVQW
jgi:anti-sigma regulatory factor (Ser/Thr protein kinase)